MAAKISHSTVHYSVVIVSVFLHFICLQFRNMSQPLRDPVSLPACLGAKKQQALAQSGFGRGRGLLGLPTTPQPAPGSIPSNQLASSLQQTSGPKYIPGLSGPPAAPVPLSTHGLPPKVPSGLAAEYRAKRKHPVSCIMEYGAITKSSVSFTECQPDIPSYTTRFCNQCTVNGRKFPKGVGNTKKEAKTDAAEKAIEILIQDTAHLPDVDPNEYVESMYSA
jgi:hypothetical protein